jgi:hypothetical protein
MDQFRALIYEIECGEGNRCYVIKEGESLFVVYICISGTEERRCDECSTFERAKNICNLYRGFIKEYY